MFSNYDNKVQLYYSNNEDTYNLGSRRSGGGGTNNNGGSAVANSTEWDCAKVNID